jgi:L-lactate dehydrogenase complex protein LldG
MNSREDILGRVRARIGRTTDRTTTATGVDAVENWLQARQPGPRPAPAGDLLATFKEKSETLATTVDVVDDASAVPATVARYLAERSLPMRAVGWLELDSQPWRDAGIAFEGRGVVDADLVGITGCFCAIAETATLMLLSGPNTPATVSLLPETHIAIVAASRVVPAMEDAWRLLRTEAGGLPRAVNFISGPSRTGDIEQTLVLGAHGPYRVHVVLVKDPAFRPGHGDEANS